MVDYGDLTLREIGDLPVHVKNRGSLTIGGQEFPYPIVADSVSVQRSGPFNKVTLTIFVGEVTMEARKKQDDDA